MKKAVVLGMILLALGVLAYADGVTVGMDFGRTQFNVASGFSGSGAPSDIYQGWVGPTGQFPTGQRMDLQFAWSNDHTGLNVTDYIGNSTQSIVNIYGTLKFIPDMFTAYIGEFSGDGWDHFRLDSAHPIHDVDNNSVGRFKGWGAILDVMPKDTGFELAMYAHLPDPAGQKNLPGLQTQTISEALSQYAVAASYMVPNTVKIAVGTQAFDLAPNSHRNVFVTAQLFMVPNLTAFDSFYYTGFDLRGTKPSIFSDELAFSYDMKPLTLIMAAFIGQNNLGGLNLTPGKEALPSIGTPDYDQAINAGSNYTAWAIQPEVIYNMGAMSLGLYASVGSTSITDWGIQYQIEPYVKLNDFGVRISFLYSGSSASGSTSTWEVPVLIDWGF